LFFRVYRSLLHASLEAHILLPIEYLPQYFVLSRENFQAEISARRGYRRFDNIVIQPSERAGAAGKPVNPGVPKTSRNDISIEAALF
jgi:hypothetical protein